MKKDTIVRTVVLAIVLLNQLLTSTGHSPLPFAEDDWADIVATLLTIIAGIWAWWKNNSFSKEAQEADRYLAALKTQKREAAAETKDWAATAGQIACQVDGNDDIYDDTIGGGG